MAVVLLSSLVLATLRSLEIPKEQIKDGSNCILSSKIASTYLCPQYLRRSASRVISTCLPFTFIRTTSPFRTHPYIIK
jgi:hypothetical protein